MGFILEMVLLTLIEENEKDVREGISAYPKFIYNPKYFTHLLPFPGKLYSQD